MYKNDVFNRQLNLNYMQPKQERVVSVKPAMSPSSAYSFSVVMAVLIAVMYKQE